VLTNPLSRAVTLREGIPVLPGVFPFVGHLPAALRDLPELTRWAGERVGPLAAEAAAAPEVPTTPSAARAFPFAEALFRETLRTHPPSA
jgi:hypothetical protein